MKLRAILASQRCGALLALVMALSVIGCVTPYQPSARRGGYSDLQLAEDVFRVSFNGNGFTHEERVRDLVLLRAAELALERGAASFAVLDQSAGAHNVLVGGGQTTGTLSPNYAGGYYFSGQTSPPVMLTRHRAELVIRLVRDDPPPGATPYSAALIRDQLRRKYSLAD